MSSEMEVLSVEEKIPQAPTVLRDAQVCIVCRIVEELPQSSGIQAFYCRRCYGIFQKELAHWKKTGITVTKRGKES